MILIPFITFISIILFAFSFNSKIKYPPFCAYYQVMINAFLFIVYYDRNLLNFRETPLTIGLIIVVIYTLLGFTLNIIFKTKGWGFLRYVIVFTLIVGIFSLMQNYYTLRIQDNPGLRIGEYYVFGFMLIGMIGINFAMLVVDAVLSGHGFKKYNNWI